MNRTSILALVVVIAVASGAAGYWALTLGNTPGEVRGATVEVTETAPSQFNDPDIRDTGEVWVKLIEGAENTIDIEAYYLADTSPSQTLDNIYNALADAAENRGVKVRILTDGDEIGREMVSELRQYANIEILGWYGSGIVHSKYLIVDERAVSVGSANLSYPAMDASGNGNREINLTLSGEKIAETYTYIFETGWTNAGGESRGAEYRWDEDWLTPVADVVEVSSPQVISTVDAYKDLFDRAKERVWVYMYGYAGGPPELDNSIQSAIERGVDVRLLVDDYSLGIGWWALQDLKNMGADVWVIEHPHAAHPKIIIVDDERAYVGSSNIHPTWMLNGREVGAIVNSEEIASQLRKIFLADWLTTYTNPF